MFQTKKIKELTDITIALVDQTKELSKQTDELIKQTEINKSRFDLEAETALYNRIPNFRIYNQIEFQETDLNWIFGLTVINNGVTAYNIFKLNYEAFKLYSGRKFRIYDEPWVLYDNELIETLNLTFIDSEHEVNPLVKTGGKIKIDFSRTHIQLSVLFDQPIFILIFEDSLGNSYYQAINFYPGDNSHSITNPINIPRS